MIPEWLVAVDPGKKVGAVAVFLRGALLQCALARGDGPFDTARAAAAFALRAGAATPDVLVTEGQRVYPGPRKADPNDLLPLAFMAGAVQGLLYRVPIRLTPLPSEWKGSVKKEIFTQRIIEGLSEAEESIIVQSKTPKSLVHNVYDAIALGKWALRQVANR